MGWETAIAAVLGGAGLGLQFWGSEKEDKVARQARSGINAAQAQANAASAAAEKAREDKARLDATRAKRDLIRQSILARATANARATSSGTSSFGGLESSGFLGAQSQIASQLGYGFGNIGQDSSISSRIFAANAAQSAAISQANLIQSNAALGINQAQGISRIGQTLISAAPTAARVGTSLFPNTVDNTWAQNTTATNYLGQVLA